MGREEVRRTLEENVCFGKWGEEWGIVQGWGEHALRGLQCVEGEVESVSPFLSLLARKRTVLMWFCDSICGAIARFLRARVAGR